MASIHIQYFKTSYGELKLGSFEHKLCLCDWKYRKKRAAVDARIQNGLKASFIEEKEEDETLEETKKQLNEYFNSERKIFTIPLLMVGTEFQKRIWHELIKIPFGDTSSYLNLAECVANKNSVRAVANANGANAMSILIPCHRIIGKEGALVGYAGGLNTKKKLLRLENDLFSPVEQLSLTL